MRPEPGTVVCALDDLPDPGAREAVIDAPDGPLAVFVVRRGDEVAAYVNRCPHLGVPLNWKPDTFLDPDGETIVCSMHSAVFRIDDGLCLAGPCQGRSLEPVAVTFRNGMIVLEKRDTPQQNP